MKRICFVVLFFLTLSIYAQTSLGLATGRIAGSNIPLNNLSKSDFDKIMQGSIFDVYTLELKATDYNTDLKKQTFLETDKGKGYQERLQTLRSRLRSDGIRTIQRQTTETTSDTASSISNYDINRGGFTITLESEQRITRNPNTGQRIEPALYVNGFKIPNVNISIVSQAGFSIEIVARLFISVPVNTATKIEGNRQVSVQLQLDTNSFAIQKIFLINERTNEVYAEADNFINQ